LAASSPDVTPLVPTVPIYGIHFSKMNMQDTIEHLTAAILSGKPHQVITANPIMVMAALNDPSVMRVMKQADLVVPDGTGVVWAAKYVGQPVAERVTGFDLMHNLLHVGESYRWKVYLLGTAPDTVAEAARRLQAQYPSIDIVGYRDGYFKADQDAEVIAEIRKAAPDMLFVARGADTQEPWIGKYRNELGVPLVMGIGGTLDIIAGKLKRAPIIFQKLRLEWFYRLLKEPKRFFRMLALPQFVVKVIRDRDNVTKL